MKLYLLLLLFVIMGAGAFSMFEIAHHALGYEHDFAPDSATSRLIFVTLWLLLMMVADVLLLNHKEIRYRHLLIGLLTLGVLAPVLFLYFAYAL